MGAQPSSHLVIFCMTSPQGKMWISNYMGHVRNWTSILNLTLWCWRTLISPWPTFIQCHWRTAVMFLFSTVGQCGPPSRRTWTYWGTHAGTMMNVWIKACAARNSSGVDHFLPVINSFSPILIIHILLYFSTFSPDSPPPGRAQWSNKERRGRTRMKRRGSSFFSVSLTPLQSIPSQFHPERCRSAEIRLQRTTFWPSR